jgi:hypothetical protein
MKLRRKLDDFANVQPTADVALFSSTPASAKTLGTAEP